MSKVINLEVEIPDKIYQIKIGSNILDQFPSELARRKSGCQVLLVSNPVVYNYYGRELKEKLVQQGFQVVVYLVPDGEEYKTWQQAGEILTVLLEAGFNRDAVVVALGGGVIGDLAGFAAGVYQRGIDLVQLPTTLLAQVDSSVGGKVAVNHPLGKNMIGVFHQPLGVWTDVLTLKTLPDREWTAGLAEVIKYGVIWDESFFAFLEKNIAQIKNRDLDVARRLIFRSCQIKAEIVAQDEKELGLRAILNFGHTMGHALEKVTAYRVYRHGEAVAIGMAWAVKMAVHLEICSKEVEERLKAVLTGLGLPVSLPEINREDVLRTLYLDKKVRERELVFVLPRKIGRVELITASKGTVLDLL